MKDLDDSEASVPHAEGEQIAHVVPVRILIAVFAALILLTLLTVAATKIDLGAGNLVVALGIASIKAALVGLYFMHLRYDRPFYALLFAGGLLFLAIFLSLTMLDLVV